MSNGAQCADYVKKREPNQFYHYFYDIFIFSVGELFYSYQKPSFFSQFCYLNLPKLVLLQLWLLVKENNLKRDVA